MRCAVPGCPNVMTFDTYRTQRGTSNVGYMEIPPTHSDIPQRLIVTRRPRASACQHTEHLSLEQEFRRTVSGRVEPDGKSVVCGSCGDKWRFMDRVQLPQWLRAELTRRRLY
jgi:hypothetical protein